jgi:type IV secretory pathway VirB10-like protein
MANPFDPTPRPGVVRIRLGLLVLMILVMLAVCGGAYYLVTHGGIGQVRRWVEKDTAVWPAWFKPQEIAYQPKSQQLEVNHVQAQRDLNAEEIAKLKGRLTGIEATLEVLKNRKDPTPPPAKAPAQPKKRSMLFVSHELKEESTPPPNTYSLAPGATKIPCQVETAINSDVEGYLTAKVTSAVYDTATGQHLLIPQNSTILGHDKSNNLVFGNERLPMISLTLAFRDGRSVELGEAPITDQQGVAGLTGEVNNHWWRLLGAVFVGGSLRAGQQVVQTEIASQGGMAPAAGAFAGTANQAFQPRVTRAMDTRPTITVEAGQLCTVLLTKPLQLPVF